MAMGMSREHPTDEQAIERYRYMLRTAPPETIEQAHAEAFARLTDRQRRLVLEQLMQATPERERRAAATDDPASLARLATRAEVRQPGSIERILGGTGGMGGPGVGGLMAGTLLSSLAGTVIGSMIARQFFAHAAEREDTAAGDTDPQGHMAEEEAGPDDHDEVAGDLDADAGGFEIDV
jgi:hypothetical protein